MLGFFSSGKLTRLVFFAHAAHCKTLHTHIIQNILYLINNYIHLV